MTHGKKKRMIPTPIHALEKDSELFIKEEDGEIRIYQFPYTILIGRDQYYPNIILFQTNPCRMIHPYQERVMSLKKDSFYTEKEYDDLYTETLTETKKMKWETSPVFFFIYQMDNYYHFLYDVMPFLISYKFLKHKYPEIRLLVQYPRKDMKSFYLFQTELISMIVNPQEWIFAEEDVMYDNIFVSSSFTHNVFNRNTRPPRCVYDFFAHFRQRIPRVISQHNDRIYISRRTWIHNDLSNIGTNYTTRRRMMNEDELVKALSDLNIVEVFPETMSMNEKISMFSRADMVIGSIGGGMANLLFSPSTTRSVVIATPFFLDINHRFRYSMEHTDIHYFHDVELVKETEDCFPLYCRISIHETKEIGEIQKYNRDTRQYLVSIGNPDTTGFRFDDCYQQRWLYEQEFDLLDKGLNSPYKVNIKNLLTMIKEMI